MIANIASMIAKAIAKGYTAKSILSHLTSNFPQYAGAIANASAMGYAADKILKHLVKSDGKKGSGDDDEYLTDSEKTDKSDKTRKRKAALGLAGAGLAVAGAGAGLASMAARGAAVYPSEILDALPKQMQLPSPNQQLQLGQISPAMPQGPTPAMPNVSPPQGPLQPGPNMGQQMQQQVEQPIANAMQPSGQDQIAQASQAIQQQQPTSIFDQLTSGVDLSQLDPEKKKQLQFLGMISDELQSKGKGVNDPEFKNLAKKIKNTLKGSPGTLIEESARQFNGSQPVQNAAVNPIVPEKKQPVSQYEPSPIEKSQSVAKGDSVVTDEGTIAEVKGISGNNFLIEENGKVRQVPMESLKSQPESIKKAKIVFDPEKVPESDRSAALAISIPMPDRSAIINMFHDGSFYLYKRKDGKPLDESVIKRVIEGHDIPISSGETFMGAWNNEKGDSRGSASYKELTAMAQSMEDMAKQDDPSKQLTFEKITDSFTHGYHKEFLRLLKEAGRQFSAKPKKPKK